MTPGCNCPCPEGTCPKCDPPTTERAHCEAAARAVRGYFDRLLYPDGIAEVADLIERERAAADAAATLREKAIADVRVDRARDQALERAASLACPGGQECVGRHDRCVLASHIRALKVKP